MEMQERKDAGQDAGYKGCRKGDMETGRDARHEGCRSGGIQRKEGSGQKRCGTEEMPDRKDKSTSGNCGKQDRWMQDWMDAGKGDAERKNARKKGCWKGGMQERGELGLEGYWKGAMQEKRDTGKDGSGTGGIQDWRYTLYRKGGL